ncbi:pentatricopeptide repeat-containing protein ELI1, chloroplastic-like isoform X3 [Asparagus officinalis]|uniref:pentatricopeptide repeat-containing protein ELI1, chloroplastic-like isoform X2 n=1 Tax=Asparagus officinalis TaxID=4686 RepID=UPI00098E7914|nr:pentatricopeptide repeat-containing protein ELI1, chloroplastic-like isoform X2 [Asparagus officinalis]XP_020246831.1 pentatricopeptide repeat-containing protein ELI1, chloroplastic-like isoform X3 [Asparagus officinalis]
MYYKCGSLEDVCLVFDKMPEKDVVAWNSMIAGHAMHGHSRCKERQRPISMKSRTGLRDGKLCLDSKVSGCPSDGCC